MPQGRSGRVRNILPTPGFDYMMLLLQGRGEMAVLPAVTAVLLHHSAMDTWTD